jgi:hypothetical protein
MRNETPALHFEARSGRSQPCLFAASWLGCATHDTCLPVALRHGFTPLRIEILGRRPYVVACDLIRPINRRMLRAIGELDDRASQVILATFLRLLPG